MKIKKKLKGQSYLRQRRRRRLILKLILTGIGLLVLLIASFILARMDYFQVSKIEIVGNKAIDYRRINIIAQTALVDYYAWLIPKGNIIWYRSSDLENKIAKAIPRLSSVESQRISHDTIRITVDERRPFGVWCDKSTPENCFLIDARGLIFDKAPFFSGQLFFRFYGALDSQEPVGLRYLSETRFTTLSNFLSGVENLGLDIKSIEKDKDKDDYFTVVINDGTKLLISDRSSLEVALANLQTLLTNKDSIFKEVNVWTKVDYLNLRSTDQAFYKMKR